MNKRTKKLILAFSLLVLLCVSYIFLVPKDNGSEEEEASSDSETGESSRLLDFNESSITAISFKGISLTLTDGKWLYTDDSDYPVDNDKAALLADTLADLSYTDRIKKSDAEDLSVYGFTQLSDNETLADGSSSENITYNNLTLEISFTADGTAHTYYIGGYNSIIGGYYMTFDNDDYIYMVNADITDAFDYENIYELLVIDTIPEIDAAYMTGMAVVTPETSYTFMPEIVSEESSTDNNATDDGVTDDDEADDSVTGDNVTDDSEADVDVADYDVTDDSVTDDGETDNGEAEADTADESSTDTSSVIWYMQSTDIASDITGEKSAADTEAFSTAVNNILTASTYKAVSYKPSDEELNAYGLTIPAYTIVITYLDDSNDTEEKTLTLCIGASDDDGNSYAVINNSSMIVTISNIDLEAILQ